MQDNVDFLILQTVLYYWQTYKFGPSITDLSIATGLSRTAVYKRLERLTAEGYLKWMLFLDERRVPRSLQLTAAGLRVLAVPVLEK
jgi:DNA-binding Lrp family transcriptional regulator